MLNIGRLAPGAADYYLGEVATSAEDYYSGRGESRGRWVGSLANRMGLEGAVSPEGFRAVLDGRHPVTGARLVRARNRRTGHPTPPAPDQIGLFDDDTLDTARVASRLKLTVGRIRQLAWAGRRLAGSQPSSEYLRGEKASVPGRSGPPSWVFPRHEVERFESDRQRAKARPGYDLTLRPPKSVSILWALGTADQRAAIRQAHQEAVDEVVAYMERHAVYARRGTADRGRIEIDGIVGAAFDHRTSRAGDPLLHTHVVVANLTRAAEGRWQAIDARGLYDHARPAGFLYQAHLRQLLTQRLGLKWEPVRNGWAEVSGVPPQVVRAFSKRRDEIEAMVAESGYTSARAHQAATLETRQAKEYGVDADALDDRWRDEAAELGFGPSEIGACFSTGVNSTPTSLDVATVFADLAGPSGLTRQASTFHRRDVVEAISERLPGLDAQGIEDHVDRFLASPLVQPLAHDATSPEWVWQRDGTRRRAIDLARYSTPDLLHLEGQLLDWARNGFGASTPVAAPGAIEAAVASRPELSVEQEAMVRALCGPGSPAIQPVAGRPGSGKTHATAAVVEALTTSGVPVVGCALSATAAAELEAATSLRTLTGREASTIARLLIDMDRDGLAAGSVVIIDEASMVGTRDLARIAQHVARAGGAIKLIGDPDQHGPVDTGGVFRTVVAAQGERLVQLDENNRQIHEGDRASIDAYRQGMVESALAHYDAAGQVVRSATADASYDAMVSEWHSAVRDGGHDPMIAGPNRIRVALNQRARARLIADGTIIGQRLVAADREFAVGDWVLARRNNRQIRSRIGGFVKNGSVGRVIAVDHDRRAITVEFKKEGAIRLPASYLDAGHLDHGYALTTYGVQGATLQRALYHAGDQSSFEEGYVALTRGRAETRIYLVDGTATADDDSAHRAHDPAPTGLDTVAAAMQRRRAKELAHDADPTAAAVHTAFAGWDLAQIFAERQRLEQVLADAPPDVAAALVAGKRRRDRLTAQWRAWDDRLTVATGRARSWNPRTRRIAAGDVATATRRLGEIEQSIARLDTRIGALRGQWQERRDYLVEHSDEVERLALVRRAEHARELQLRSDARVNPSPVLVAAYGTEPADPARRQSWLAAVESAAVDHERFGREPEVMAAERADMAGAHLVEVTATQHQRRDVALEMELEL